MKNPTLSLAMITNTSKQLADSIGSVAPYVDEIVIVDNGVDEKVKKIAKKFNAKYVHVDYKSNPEYFCEYPKDNFEPNFTMLRRLSFDMCTKDWILWYDVDDVFINPQLIKENLINAEQSGLNMLNLQYKYEIDENGEVLKVHNKERFVKRGEWVWEFDPEWAVHENLYPVDEKKVAGGMIWDMVVEHHKKPSNRRKSSFRNYNILMWMLKKEKFQKDPRVWYLLARELVSLPNYEQAITIFNKYLAMEYASHDALEACIQCCEIYEALGDFKTALVYAMRGIGIRPDHPIGYLYAARYLNYQHKSQEALEFIKQAETKQINPLDQMIQEPLTIAWLTVSGLMSAYNQQKKYKKILKVIEENRARFSGEWLKELENNAKDAEEKLMTEKAMDALKLLVDNKTGELLHENRTPTLKDYETIFDLFDPVVRMSPIYINLKRKLGEFKVHDDNEITIVHMSNFEAWDPESLYKNGGGGSETACVELSTAWAKRGYNVTVYAEPSVDGTVFNNVLWKKVSSLNLADKFNIFISLRAPSLFSDYEIDAKKKYLWLQDIMYPDQFTEDLYEQVDKIIVLSNYHRDTAPNVPEGKFYYTTNGINLRLIEEVEKEGEVKRVKNKCIYFSSADRGLGQLIKMVPNIKREVPDADFYVAYGWKSWNINKIPEMEKLKNDLIKGMKKAGMHELGRIGKKELYRLLLSCDYHTYPLVGPAETSCIAVMESQALGCIPITTGVTALEETQFAGIKVSLDRYEKAVIDTMQKKNLTITDDSEYREKMMKEARQRFNWETISDRWVEDLFQK